jgi:hypothetical protein
MGRANTLPTLQKMCKPKGPMSEWRKEIYREKAAQGWATRRQNYGGYKWQSRLT